MFATDLYMQSCNLTLHPTLQPLLHVKITVPRAMLATADGSLSSELWPWVRMPHWFQAAVRPPVPLVLCPALPALGCWASHC